MKLYFAPMEGITTYTYRNAHKNLFGGVDTYYAPFITPTENEKLGIKALRDVHPFNNRVSLKVQVLTNNADAFLRFEETVAKVGYNEININLGCPSSTVVKKNKGSGMLRDTDYLDRFLEEVFENTRMKISIKTRIGFLEGDEMDTLMDIYNKYPICQLTIHPRTRAEMYKGEPDMDVFDRVYKKAKMPICYNGNIFTHADFKRIEEKYPALEGVMLGRGAIANPALFREICGGEKLSNEELVEFSLRLMEDYNSLYKT
ncbi:MAG: tRNA dihydrouridine synthase, partial [Clostridia bacterium]